MRLETLTKNLTPHSCYNIGFLNAEGNEDETQFDVKNNPAAELKECWEAFCKENQCDPDSVLYVEADAELSQTQVERVDEVYEKTLEYCRALTKDTDLPWDMAYLGPIADMAAEILSKQGFAVHFQTITEENGHRKVSDFFGTE